MQPGRQYNVAFGPERLCWVGPFTRTIQPRSAVLSDGGRALLLAATQATARFFAKPSLVSRLTSIILPAPR